MGHFTNILFLHQFPEFSVIISFFLFLFVFMQTKILGFVDAQGHMAPIQTQVCLSTFVCFCLCHLHPECSPEVYFQCPGSLHPQIQPTEGPKWERQQSRVEGQESSHAWLIQITAESRQPSGFPIVASQPERGVKREQAQIFA